MIEIEGHQEQILTLKVSGDNFYKDVEFIKKELLGRKYNDDTKLWEIPILKTNFKILEKAKKHFADHDALWAFEDQDYAVYLNVENIGDDIQIRGYYDKKIVEIIKAKKVKSDIWDGEKWIVKMETWNLIKNDIVKHLMQIEEKYEINV